MRQLNSVHLLVLIVFCLVCSCAKPKPVSTVHSVPPPNATVPEPPPVPRIEKFAAEQAAISNGASTVLRWAVADATEIRIDPAIGSVDREGSRTVTPTESTSYTLTAKGPGGSASAVAVVTVVPVSKSEQPVARRYTIEQAAEQLEDIYFNLDEYRLRDDARRAVEKNAGILRAFLLEPVAAIVRIEGHADERGSTEYNYGISCLRAEAVKELLVSLGVNASKLEPVGYSKETPVCTESNEECWQRNRRVHLVPMLQEQSQLSPGR